MLGITICDHCVQDFDLETVKNRVKFLSQNYCLACRELDEYLDMEDIYLSNHEPRDPRE